jgi:hypothetical protein
MFIQIGASEASMSENFVWLETMSIEVFAKEDSGFMNLLVLCQNSGFKTRNYVDLYCESVMAIAPIVSEK